MEQFPNTPNLEKENDSGNKLKKIINSTITAGLIAGASGMITNEAEAQEKKVSYNTTEQVGSKIVSAEKMLEKLDEPVLDYIKSLGMFDKLGLINDVKEHGDLIKSFLKDGINDTEKTQSLFSKAGAELKTVLSLYVRGLKEVEKSNPSIYKSAVSKTNNLIDFIKTSSIVELQEKFK